MKTQEVMAFLQGYLASEDVEKIVIGMPAQPGEAFEQGLKRFVSELQKQFSGIEICFEQEDFSSHEARQVVRQAHGTHRKKSWDKSLIDKVSAVLILQRYLGHI